MHEVQFGVHDVSRLATLVGEQRWAEVHDAWQAAAAALAGRTVWHVNATATGGGVAEMLTAILPLWRGLDVDARWLVLDGDPDFFTTTKRLHNVLHGFAGDGGDLGKAERAGYEATLRREMKAFAKLLKPGDLAVLHDPQTLGLVPGARAAGAHTVWRCHIGRDEPNALTDLGWGFLAPYLEDADRVVVSRLAYAPPSVPPEKIVVITPCLDPFTAKNIDISPEVAAHALTRVGLLDGELDGAPSFPRRDGTTGTLREHTGAAVEGGPLPADARVVLQVSRWDRLKDMPGVMTGFAHQVEARDAHLVLCGPAVEGVSDDPEGAEVLAECRAAYAELPPAVRDRVHLFCIPMDDVDENAYIVNALQRHARIIVQKSLFEGFGLTVTEAMWKGRPVVASAIGGIQDQIDHGIDGMLLADATDVEALGHALNLLLAVADLAERLGEAARHKVLRRFLGDGSMYAYARLMSDLLGAGVLESGPAATTGPADTELDREVSDLPEPEPDAI